MRLSARCYKVHRKITKVAVICGALSVCVGWCFSESKSTTKSASCNYVAKTGEYHKRTYSPSTFSYCSGTTNGFMGCSEVGPPVKETFSQHGPSDTTCAVPWSTTVTDYRTHSLTSSYCCF